MKNGAKTFVIWGSAGHAKVLAEIIRGGGGRLAAFFDNDPRARPALPRVPLYRGQAGFQAWKKQQKNRKEIQAAVAIGGDRGEDRHRLLLLLSRAGLPAVSLIHPSAVVASSARLGKGAQILAGAILAPEVILGEACIVNHRASLDHECVLGNGVHVAPGAILCGCVQVGNYSMIGAGAVILPRIKVGRHCVVGAGAVLTKSLPDHSVAWGVPAQIQRRKK